MIVAKIITGISIIAVTLIIYTLIRSGAAYLVKRLELKMQAKAEDKKIDAAEAVTTARNKHELSLLDKKQNHELELLKYKQELLDKK